jgi:branched-chain amino acid transport system permease protein
MSYFLHLVVLFEIYVLVAASLNLLVGFAGLIQVAHAAYFGVGAYVSAILAKEMGFSFLASMALGGLAAALLSFLVSLPAWRFRGDAFVLMSLSVQMALVAVFQNAEGLTGGPFGIGGIPKPTIFGSTFDTKGLMVALFGAVVVATLGLIGLLMQSPFGRALQAVRDDELAARSLGIPCHKLKTEVFAIASGLAGVAGAMYSSYVTYIDPTSFGLDASILMLSMVIVGGTGNLKGPVVGTITLICLPEILRFADLPSSFAASGRLLAYGLLLVVLMRVRPQGLAGRYRFE